MKINYIRLLTSNFDDMVEFYEQTLELEKTHINATAKYAEFKTDTSSISIFDRSSMINALGMDDPKVIHECQDKNMIVLYTETLDEIVQKLEDKGIVFLFGVTERKDWGTKTVHLRDPEGNILEIYTSLNQ